MAKMGMDVVPSSMYQCTMIKLRQRPRRPMSRTMASTWKDVVQSPHPPSYAHPDLLPGYWFFAPRSDIHPVTFQAAELGTPIEPLIGFWCETNRITHDMRRGNVSQLSKRSFECPSKDEFKKWCGGMEVRRKLTPSRAAENIR